MKSTQKMYNLMRSTLSASEDRAFWLIQLILIELGFSWQERRSLPEKLFGIIRTEPHEPTAAQKVWDLLGSQLSTVTQKLSDRSELIATQVSAHLTGKNLLDFGCGDGLVGLRLGMDNFTASSHDVADYRLNRGERFTSNWDDLGRLSFDSTLAVAVFHHCDDPDLEIERLANITRRLVVIESVIDSAMPWEIQALVDWIYNRGLHPGAQIPVPGNFRTVEGWSETFQRHGFTVHHIEDLGIDLPIVPEHHVLFVLDREI